MTEGFATSNEPFMVREACHASLKPGVQLWLETPSIDSFGYARFQKIQRGLEGTETPSRVQSAVIEPSVCLPGIYAPHDRTHPSVWAGMFQASFAMDGGRDPYQAAAMSKSLRLCAAIAGLMEMLMPERREFLTVTARKSAA